MSPAPATRIVVTAAVIRKNDQFLLTRRLRGTHLAGCWEFPGGKCGRGEGHAACLERELAEELGVAARIGARIFDIVHEYPERTVELHFFECEIAGEPQPMIGQEMQWVARGDLGTLDFPEADAALIRMLQEGR
jgi:8-oxo-dGTP diphosphatase